jgi:hypothetical protein
MKLYTEEELLKAMAYARSYDANWVITENEILKLITPIELPSDEEISIQASNRHYGTNFKYVYASGAKWMREQILNQNK